MVANYTQEYLEKRPRLVLIANLLTFQAKIPTMADLLWIKLLLWIIQ